MLKEESDLLMQLAQDYQSDKLTHGYIDFYAKELPEWYKCKSLLEIGAWKGQSLFIWQKFYGDADIYTLENFYYPDCVSKVDLESNGIHVIQGNQENTSLLRGIDQQFDVIIDDGSHLPDHQQITFKHLFQHNLNPGGLYVIEDLHTNLDKHFWHNIDEYNDTALVALHELKNQSDHWENKFFTCEEVKSWSTIIDYIHVYEIETDNDYNSIIGFIKKNA